MTYLSDFDLRNKIDYLNDQEFAKIDLEWEPVPFYPTLGLGATYEGMLNDTPSPSFNSFNSFNIENTKIIKGQIKEKGIKYIEEFNREEVAIYIAKKTLKATEDSIKLSEHQKSYAKKSYWLNWAILVGTILAIGIPIYFQRKTNAASDNANTSQKISVPKAQLTLVPAKKDTAFDSLKNHR